MSDIELTSPTSTPVQIVLQEKKTTDEFIVTRIVEQPLERSVRAEIEFGPFENSPDGILHGSSRRGFTVWENEEYDAVKLTWDNQALIDKIVTILGRN